MKSRSGAQLVVRFISKENYPNITPLSLKCSPSFLMFPCCSSVPPNKCWSSTFQGHQNRFIRHHHQIVPDKRRNIRCYM